MFAIIYALSVLESDDTGVQSQRSKLHKRQVGSKAGLAKV